jgi:hypothetical protein
MTTLRRRIQRHAEPRSRVVRFSAIAVVVLALSVIATACDNSSDSASTPKATVAGDVAERAAYSPVGPEITVAKYVDSIGEQYAGPCDLASLPRDKGKWCSTLVEAKSTDDEKVYDVGPVGEKAEKRITVKRHGQRLLVPGENVPVAEGNIGDVNHLTYEQMLNDPYIAENLQRDLALGIGKGLSELNGVAGAVVQEPPTTAPPAGGGGGGIIVSPGGSVDANGYPNNGGIVVEPPSVAGEVVFRGTGCAANERLNVYFDGTPIGTVAAGQTGDFSGSVSVPAGTPSGTHTVTIQGATCSSTFTVTVEGTLAFTGSSSHTGTYVWGGIAAIIVGLVLVVATRRRRRRLHDLSGGARAA